MADTSAPSHIVVSPEMTAVLGGAALPSLPLPPKPLAIAYDLGGPDAAASLRVLRAACIPAAEGPLVTLLVSRDAFLRLGGKLPDREDRALFHLPSELRTIVLAIHRRGLGGEPLLVYRLGKSIELFCETLRLAGQGALVPLAPQGLSMADARRLMDARRMIDERWSEKLTLDGIARACGLNRAKLTQAYRDMFGTTIAEALAEQRLHHASRMLLTTDLPISSIGYENGYLNNASFARAFVRRFGVTPSGFRSCGIAA